MELLEPYIYIYIHREASAIANSIWRDACGIQLCQAYRAIVLTIQAPKVVQGVFGPLVGAMVAPLSLVAVALKTASPIRLNEATCLNLTAIAHVI